MKRVAGWIGRTFLALAVLVALLLAPVGYTEIACTGTPTFANSEPEIDDEAWQRAESLTLTTYPEWHIVHAYDDYAQVLRDGDPHDYGFLDAIAGFWTALCPLKERADAMGGMTGESKMTIYTIGVSFTAEFLAKAAYEETLGRLATWVRGPEPAPLDIISGQQAEEYAAFLQQVPWYKWDFERDRAVLRASATDAFRDRERAVALGFEYKVKALYGKLIEKAVAEIGADELRIRSVIAGIEASELASVEGVDIVGATASGILIETDRYRAFTRILQGLAESGADLVEIAGNDEIMFTAISSESTERTALYSFERQGFGDYRHLILIPVSELLDRIRNPGSSRLEHVHDY